jgi:multiple sugar transport system permease protein
LAHQNKLVHNKKNYFHGLVLPYGLLLPTILILVGIIIIPSVSSIINSLFSWNLLKPSEKAFTYASNYIKILTDQTFQRSFVFTFLLISVTVLIEVVLGVLAALIVIKMPIIIRKFTATALFIPYMLSPLTVGLVWKLLFTYDGLINGFLGFVGIEAVTWMVTPISAFAACAISEIWRSYPFGFLLLLSTLSTLPTEPFEAAKVDGASKIQVFFHITLPLIKSTLIIILIYQIVLKLRVFDLVYLLTNGGPVDYTTPLGLLIYRYYFRYYEAGQGAATAVFVLLSSIIIAILVIKNLSVEE